MRVLRVIRNCEARHLAMNDSEQALDFSTVIASTVHDMKNSLALLMQAHTQWLERLPDPERQTSEQGVMEFEFAHLNGLLVQLLGLYKLRSEEHTSELQSLMRISYAVFCLKKKT